MKTCSKCNQAKDESEFYKRKNRNIGITSRCKVCLTKIFSGYKDNPATRRRNDLKKYGLTQCGFDILMHNQNGVCAICKKGPETQKRKKYLSVDHDHRTGKVRGLLCDRCNRGIGVIGENEETLSNAIKYLNKFLHHPEHGRIGQFCEIF